MGFGRAEWAPSLALACLAASAAACSDYRYAFVEGPVTKQHVATPPPEDFTACSDPHVKHQLIDADADGRTDAVRIVSADGDVEVCRGADSNNDGRIDTWDLMKDGKVTRRAHDSDADGRVDQVWTWPDATRPACALVARDHDGDGRADGATLDLCAALVPGQSALPTTPTAGAPTTSAPTTNTPTTSAPTTNTPTTSAPTTNAPTTSAPTPAPKSAPKSAP
jgi:hypothetical protein